MLLWYDHHIILLFYKSSKYNNPNKSNDSSPLSLSLPSPSLPSSRRPSYLATDSPALPYLPACFIHQPTYLFIYLPAYLPTSPTDLPTCLPTYQLAYQPTYYQLPTDLRSYLLIGRPHSRRLPTDRPNRATRCFLRPTTNHLLSCVSHYVWVTCY